jgi:flagellar biosynthesis/type III secretory pathway chaperone
VGEFLFAKTHSRREQHMAGMISQLTHILAEQTERHSELLGLSLEEKDAIIANDIDQLQNLVNLKNMVITQNNRLERERIALIKDMAEVMNYSNKEPTLAEILQIIEGQPGCDELRAAGEKLRSTATDLKEANDINKSLLMTSMEFVEYSLNALKSTIEPEAIEIPTKFNHPR